MEQLAALCFSSSVVMCFLYVYFPVISICLFLIPVNSVEGINLKERAEAILSMSTSDDCDENITRKCHSLAIVTPIVIAEEGLSSTKNKSAIANEIRCVIKNVTSCGADIINEKFVKRAIKKINVRKFSNFV